MRTCSRQYIPDPQFWVADISGGFHLDIDVSCRYLPVPGLYWADAASIGPVPARYWHITACLQGYISHTLSRRV